MNTEGRRANKSLTWQKTGDQDLSLEPPPPLVKEKCCSSGLMAEIPSGLPKTRGPRVKWRSRTVGSGRT